MAAAKALSAHHRRAGKESWSQQIRSRSRETKLLRACTSRSDNIDASSETALGLALGPGILQLTSIPHKALP